MNDPTLRDRYNAAYVSMGGTAFLCLALHSLFWSVYFWLPASFLSLLLVGLMARRSIGDNLFTVLFLVLVWIFTTGIPLLMILLGKDLYRGILR